MPLLILLLCNKVIELLCRVDFREKGQLKGESVVEKVLLEEKLKKINFLNFLKINFLLTEKEGKESLVY